MAYRKVIEVNPLSKKSINEAIKELKAEKEVLEKKKNKFTRLVAKEVAKRIEERYEEVDNSNVKKGHITVWADGGFGKMIVGARGVGLFFVEFGTGTLAETQRGYLYGFYPGSWSQEHEKTFEMWVNSNGSLFSNADGSYKYNNEAADAFTKAIGNLDEIVRQAADEVFG